MTRIKGSKNKSNVELLKIYLSKQDENKPKSSIKRPANNSK